MSQTLSLLRLSLGAGALVGFQAAPALAQSPSVDPIEFCRGESGDDQERIACLESAIRGLLNSAGPVAAVTPLSDTPSGALADDDETLLAEAEPEVEEPVGIGAEQVRARVERKTEEGKKQRRQRIASEASSTRLVDFASTSAGRLILVLENGQVWAQRAGDNQKVRLREGDTPTIKIRRGAISGYRLEFSSPNVTIIAERLK